VTEDAVAEVGPSHAADGSSASWASHTWITGPTAALVATGIFLSLLMGALDQFVVLTALTNIVADLGQPNGLTFVVSGYLITSTVAVPIFARLSDIMSRRNIFLVGMSIFIAGSALAGLSQNLSELILFRGIQGFGSGCFFPVGISIIAVAFDPTRRARLTGAFSGVFGIATVAGPFLGSYIVDNTTWRWVFYINIPIGLLGMIVLAVALGALRPEVRERFDAVGAALLSTWVGALMFALYEVSDAGWAWTDARTLGLLLLAAVVFAIFTVYELRVDRPLVPLRLFRDRVVASTSMVAMLSRAAVFSLITIISVYVGVVIYHNGPGAADAVRNLLYFMVIPMVLSSVAGGQLLTRVPYRPLVAMGMALSTLGLYLLTAVNASTPTWQVSYGFLPTGGIALALIPIGAGLGLTFGPTTIAVQFRVDRRDVGQATGLIQFLGTLGASLGLSLFSTFQTWRVGALAPAPLGPPCGGPAPPPSCGPALLGYQQAFLNAVVTSYVDVFTLMLALSILAFVAALFITGRMPRTTAESPRMPTPE
jgi:EmrB/QacA subfamily drug resistance transporter